MALLCLCHGVSERKVDKVIDRGAASVDEVGAACRAGTDCGSCRETIADRLAERCAHDGREGRRLPMPAFAD